MEVSSNFAEQQYQETNHTEVGNDVKDSQLIAGNNNTLSKSSNDVHHHYHGNVINQYGTQDNIAGDKVAGDRIDTQINHAQEITDLSQKLDALIEDLSEEYNPNKPRGQANIQRDALETISQNTALKQRIINALKAGLAETLEQTVKQPLAKILVKSCQGFLKSS